MKNISLIDTENRYLIYITESQESRVKRLEWPKNFEFKIINFPRLWTQAGLALHTFLDPLDILFVPSHTLPLIRRPGLKTVITVHDLGAEYLPRFHQLKQILYLKLMTHYQIKTASSVISVSEATKNDLVKKIGIKPEKIQVVYEGVEKTVFKKISKDVVNDIVKTYDIERGKYFLFVGTIQPRKNLERLIKSFAEFLKWEMRSEKKEVANLELWEEAIKEETTQKLKKLKTSELTHTSKFKLVLVGSKGWKSDSIYQLPKQLGIQDNVLFLGRLSDQELVGLYNGALGLTYPSLFEGFGLPILEAFACGCPVITSGSSSMPEVAGDGAILVNPENDEEILKAMKQLFANDTLRLSLINKGILRLGRFDWKLAARQTIDVLERTAKS